MAVYECSIYRQCSDTYYRLDFDNNGCARRLVAIYMREDRPEERPRILVDFMKYAEDSRATSRSTSSRCARGICLGRRQDGRARLRGRRRRGLRRGPGHRPRDLADGGQMDQQSRRAGAPLPRGDQPDARQPQGRRAQGDARSSPRRRQARREGGRGRGETGAPPAAGPRKTGKAEEAVDLMVLIHPRLLDKARIRSLLAESIGVPGKGAMPPERAEQLAATARRSSLCESSTPTISRSRSRRPWSRLGPGRSGADDSGARPARVPGRPDPAGGPARGARANSRQRAAAARQVPLWLVARACRRRQPGSERIRLGADRLEAPGDRGGPPPGRQHGPDGDAPRAGRAVAGARRPPGGRDRLVQDARDRDRAARSGRRSKPERARRHARGRPALHRAGGKRLVRRVSYQDPPKAQAVTPKARPRPAAGGNLPVLTLDRFEQAMQIARLAAERELPDLTFRAVREALRRPAGGADQPPHGGASMRMAQRGIDEGSTDPVAPRVVASLGELERLWEEHHAPPDGRLRGPARSPSCRPAARPRSSSMPRRPIPAP